ncbi:hypothetical protein ABFP60_09800 [Clostridioides difficile]
MFISIPKEFFVPVVFGEGFILNEQNNHLELDTDMYRESTGKKTINETINKTYLDKSKSAKEKQDIIDEEIEMNENKCNNKAAQGSTVGQITTNQSTKPSTMENTNQGNIMYMSLKGEKELEKICENNGEIFAELDDEFIENIDIKGCSEK